jgi:hypothetical protein
MNGNHVTALVEHCPDQSILISSRRISTIATAAVIHPNMTKPLQESLFHKDKGGLWNAHCQEKLIDTMQIQQEVVKTMKIIQGIADQEGCHFFSRQ